MNDMYQRDEDMRPAPPTHVSVPPEPGGAPAGFSTQMPLGRPAYAQPPSGNSNGRNGLIAAVAALTIALVGVVGYLVLRGDDEQADDRATPSTEVVNERERPTQRERTTPEPTDSSDSEQVSADEPGTEAPLEDPVVTEPPFADSTDTAPPFSDELTSTQQAAADDARVYLDLGPRSRAFLIELVMDDGAYTEDDATIAVDSLNVDWYDQASLAAPEFMNYGPVSRQAVIDTMTDEFNKFTIDEATYGVDSMGADWNDQAVSDATSIAITSPDWTCDDVVNFMTEYHKFTYDEAVYGATEVGVC